MDVERQAGSRGSRAGVRSVKVLSQDEKDLNATFKWLQIVFRFLAVLYGVAALAFLGYIYEMWRREPSVRVDVVFPSFFPVTAAVIVDTFEIMYLLLMKRKWLINPFVVVFDVIVVGVSIFCFLILGMTDYEGNQKTFAPGSTRSVWATDMNNAMIFMIVFCILHAMFVILSVGGFVYRRMYLKKERKRQQIARSQAEMVKFDERQKRQAEMAASRDILAWREQTRSAALETLEPTAPKKQLSMATTAVNEVSPES